MVAPFGARFILALIAIVLRKAYFAEAPFSKETCSTAEYFSIDHRRTRLVSTNIFLWSGVTNQGIRPCMENPRFFRRISAR